MEKEPGAQRLRFRVRFAYRVSAGRFRILTKRKDIKKEAAAKRRKKVNILQQVPVKGIEILEIDPNHTVCLKEEEGRGVAYAPVEVLFEADSLEDAIPFLMSNDFSNVELICPEQVALSTQALEQVIEKMQDELEGYRSRLKIRYGPGNGAYLLKDLLEADNLPNTDFLPNAGVPPESDIPTEVDELPEEDADILQEPDAPAESAAAEDAAEEEHRSKLEDTEDFCTDSLADDGISCASSLHDVEPLVDSCGGSTKKTLRLEWDLEIIAVLALLLAGIIALGGDGWLHYLRIALGLPFVLFFPGYTLIAALFPKKDDLDGIERVALSFGLSIAVAPLIGLGLNYSPWGIRLAPILLSLIVFILCMGATAFFRRDRLPREDRFCPTFEFEVPIWREQPVLDKVLSIALIAAILFAAGSICYVAAVPKTGEKFTEFYILGMDGKAEGYPRELAAEEEGEVIAGVVNHEYRQEKYFVEIKMDDLTLPRKGPITLGHEKKWEEAVTFSYPGARENLKVEFLLYREGDEKPYRSLHLWVNVK